MADLGEWPETAPLSIALAVDDLRAARDLYVSFGFEQLHEIGEADASLAFVMLRRGSSLLLLGPADEPHYSDAERGALVRRGPRGLGTTVVLDVPDLEAAWSVVQHAGLEVLLEPVDEFYGERVFLVRDPDGYDWKFCHRPGS